MLFDHISSKILLFLTLCEEMTSQLSHTKVFNGKSEIKGYIADYVAAASSNAIRSKGVFNVALSGGSMPELLGELIERDIDWAFWYVFFADERCVPLDHNDSNFKSCHENLFARVPIPSANIIALDNIDDPEAAAISYESRLRSIIPDLSLDLVLLGLGPDGHTASLFPGHPLLEYVGDRAVMPIFDSPKPPKARITLTLDTINRSRQVMFVTTGTSKAEKVRQILHQQYARDDVAREGDGDVAENVLPAGRVRVKGGNSEVLWILDTDAASLLDLSLAAPILLNGEL